MKNIAIYGSGEVSKKLKEFIDSIYNAYMKQFGNEECMNVLAYITEEIDSLWDKEGIENIPIIGIEQLELFRSEGIIQAVVIPENIFDSDVAYGRLNNSKVSIDEIYVAHNEVFENGKPTNENIKDLFSIYFKYIDGQEMRFAIKNEPLVTIYTQSYNGEAYIRQCIESVINQSYQNWEYFVCNHGSKDNTLEIIKEYAAKDSRIKVIDKPNSERGFYPDMIREIGKGKYFAMLDSDDYWHKDNLTHLVSFAEMNRLDMAVCSILKFEKDGEYTDLRHCSRAFVYDISENDKYFSVMYKFLRTTWGKVIRMDILKKADFSVYKINAMDFISDDTAFTLANYEQCRRVGAIPDYLLYYRITAGSVTGSYKPKMIDNNVNIYMQLVNVLKNIGDDSEQSRKYICKTYWGGLKDALYCISKSGGIYDVWLEEISKICQLQITKELVNESCIEKDDCLKIIKKIMEGCIAIKHMFDEEQCQKLEKILCFMKDTI